MPGGDRDQSHSSAVYHVRRIDFPLDAVVVVPGSKSIANRALICATLATGISTLRNVPGGDDTVAMIDCVASLGAGVGEHHENPAVVDVHGTNGALRGGPMVLNTRLAGTTSRFVTALCALGSGHYEIDGHGPLRARPMGALHDALTSLGVQLQPGDRRGHLPVTVTGLAGGPTGPAMARGEPRTVRMSGGVSSQYISALMMIGPYLGGLRIELTTPLVSRPYVAITAAVMASFGVRDVTILPSTVVVPSGRYLACDYTIEPDASSASYPLAAAAVCGGVVTVPDLGTHSLQGDAAFADVLASMGCLVTRGPHGTGVKRVGPLVGVQVNMADMSDLVPSLAIVAPFATTPTEITGVGFIRAKESDRLGDLAGELRKCGIDATELADGMRIQPGVTHGAGLETHHDHRLAMAFAVLGLRVPDIRVHDPDVVSKSWPDFWMMLELLRGPQ